MKSNYNMTFRISSKDNKDLLIVDEEYFIQPDYLKYELLQEVLKFVDAETKSFSDYQEILTEVLRPVRFLELRHCTQIIFEDPIVNVL